MPIYNGSDSIGTFYQYGVNGKKYYYNPSNHSSKIKARNQAKIQGTAIYLSSRG